MDLIEKLQAKLQRHPKRIVYPEGTDPRIIQTARQFATRRCGVPILLGNRTEIKERALALDVNLGGIRILDPRRSDDLELFLPMVNEIPKFSSLSKEQKEELVMDRHNFAALMLVSGRADALVGGATNTTSSGLRSLFRIVPTQEGVKTASSMLILDQDNEEVGVDGLLFLADCGVIPDPTDEQLADIAISTARIAHHLTDHVPRLAFLSFATQARKIAHPSIEKIRRAVGITKAKAECLQLSIEAQGELQLDTAINPKVAKYKGMEEDAVAGRANVLIFPDLNSGNIAAKMIQHIAGARTYGQIIVGLQRPCSEISRGAHIYDIFGTSVITASQAIDRSFLF